jgi:hypothetical protein
MTFLPITETFTPKDLTANVIGKKVMRTQDGAEISMA